MSLNRLMVFTDFTLASNVAAAHCYQVASAAKSEVLSLHVISSDEDLEWAKQKCTEQVKKLKNYDSNIPFTPLATSQSLFQGLSTWLEKNDVNLTFMATHGKKDLQFLTGSNALKLIFNAEIPVLVVQQHSPLRPYRKILLPVFSHQAGMQFPVVELQGMVRLFGAQVTVMTPAPRNDEDRDDLQKEVDRIKRLLDEHTSDIVVKQSDQPEKKFGQAVIDEANAGGADLVSLLVGAKHHRDEAEKTKKFYQALITNEYGTPVLCL